jgi:hypothetical protein
MARSVGSSLLAALAALAVLAVAPWHEAPDARADRPALPPEPVVGACTRKRADAELRAKAPGRSPTRRQVDAELERCFRARIAACQLALDADADEGLACWRQAPWPEVPESVPPEDIAKAGLCLLELKGVIADLRRCRTKKPEQRDACVTPYIGYAPQCPLLKAERVWRAFPGRDDVERVAKADAERRAKDPKAAREQAERAAKEAREAKLKAVQEAREAKIKAAKEAREAKLKAVQEARRAAEEARIAKETERCFGRTTLEFAARMKAQPGPRAVAGCKYQASGRVLSRNNVFVQVIDPAGSSIFLLRTKEPFAEGDQLSDRTAAFDSIEEVELADGSKRPFAVFKLDPAPPKKK